MRRETARLIFATVMDAGQESFVEILQCHRIKDGARA
jgi:hypothetical protein